MNLKRIIREEMDDLQWIRDTNPKFLPKNFKYIINLCGTNYVVEDLRTKFIELFGTDYTHNKGIVNWFDNRFIEQSESDGNGLILDLSRNNGKLSGEWDDCVNLMEYGDYEELRPEDFLNFYKKTPK